MVKKILIIVLSIVLLVSYGCKRKEDISYINGDYDFIFSPPDNWSDNYFISTDENAKYCIRIRFKSEILSKENGKDSGPNFISIYVISSDKYKEWSSDSQSEGGGPYIKHKTKDLGLWIVYPDPIVEDEEQKLYWTLFEDIKPENIEKYLKFNDIE